MRRIRDAVVVITGAGSGIGRATALAFAREGARLHLVDVKPDGLEGTLERIDGAATGHVLDVSDADAVLDLARRVRDADGRVDVLHNNAGYCIGGPVERFSLDDWRSVVDVNLMGVVHGIHAFLPGMIEQGGGAHIVNTASMAGLVGLPFVVPYCTTKHAVVGLSESLSAELAVHGIRVTVVCTGMVRTNVVGDARLELPGRWVDRVARAYDLFALPPGRVAGRIVEAVRRDRSHVVHAGELMPLHLTRRLSARLYARMARTLTRGAHAWGRRVDR